MRRFSSGLGSMLSVPLASGVLASALLATRIVRASGEVIEVGADGRSPEVRRERAMAAPRSAIVVAERAGFEPARTFLGPTPLAGERLRPDSATAPLLSDRA